jgi:hypothetical protein
VPTPELFPTKTRLKLLREVRLGHVYEWLNSRQSHIANDGGKVTAAVAELRDAGWISLEPPATGNSRRRLWATTGTGRAVLDANPERTTP